MSIKLELPEITELKPRIAVVGVGGAGGNAINNMIASGLDGVEFVVANTDAQALAISSAERRIQLGVNLTEGLGAGSRPEIGHAAAEEAINDVRTQIAGSHMVFIAAGMGGGTGTGAASVVARVAREEGALTVGVVTKPFLFEGGRRMRVAEDGIADLKQHVDTLIVIPNQNLFRIASKNTTFAEAFVLADQVLHSGIACITDLIVREGLINLDFADVKVVMSNMGAAMMGMGEASGEDRAVKAAESAIANPLLDGVTVRGARGLVISIAGGKNLTLFEVDEAASRVRAEVDPEAHIIVGATFDDTLDDKIRVSILASGLVAQGRESGPLQNTQPSYAQTAAPSATSQRPVNAEPSKVAAPSDQQKQKNTSDGKGELLKKKLSDALRGSGDNQPLQLDSSQAVTSDGAGPVNEVWKAPGNVTIEAGPPDLMGNGAHKTKSGAAAGENEHFQPKAPSANRKPTRRMPAPDDFPVVGQREANGSGRPNKESLPKKLGFFERLKSAATGVKEDTPAAQDDVKSGGLSEGQSLEQNAARGVRPLVGPDGELYAKSAPKQKGSSPIEGGEDIDFPMIFQDRAKGS